MGKHLRHSEVKHPDKFAETLSALWAKSERYIVRIGIGMGIGTLAIAVWFGISSLLAGRSDRPWEQRFQLAEEAERQAQDDPEAVSDKFLAKMDDFAHDNRGEAAAAVTLLELAQGHARRAASLRDEKPKEARDHLQKAAGAAEQFIADFPDHRHVATAQYEAGKARFDMGEWERAAEHFEKAAASQVPSLVAMAKWHAGYCYEQLGRLDQARRKYEELRNQPLAGWCAEQADFALAQLGRRPPKAPQRDTGAPAPSKADPAPSK